jgi:hypothetical protein
VGEVELEELRLSCENAFDLLSEDSVATFFIVEELAAFGGIVDYLGDLLNMSLGLGLERGKSRSQYLLLVHSILPGFCQ